MENKKKKRIVIALGGNALGNTLPEQMKAVKITAKAIVDLIEEGCEVIVAHGNGPPLWNQCLPGSGAGGAKRGLYRRLCHATEV